MQWFAAPNQKGPSPLTRPGQGRNNPMQHTARHRMQPQPTTSTTTSSNNALTTPLNLHTATSRPSTTSSLPSLGNLYPSPPFLTDSTHRGNQSSSSGGSNLSNQRNQMMMMNDPLLCWRIEPLPQFSTTPAGPSPPSRQYGVPPLQPHSLSTAWRYPPSTSHVNSSIHQTPHAPAAAMPQPFASFQTTPMVSSSHQTNTNYPYQQQQRQHAPQQQQQYSPSCSQPTQPAFSSSFPLRISRHENSQKQASNATRKVYNTDKTKNFTTTATTSAKTPPSVREDASLLLTLRSSAKKKKNDNNNNRIASPTTSSNVLTHAARTTATTLAATLAATPEPFLPKHMARTASMEKASPRLPTHSLQQPQTRQPQQAHTTKPFLIDTTVATANNDNTSLQQQHQTASIPLNHPTRLALPRDEIHLNSLHCFIRSHLLEVFVIQPVENKPNTMAGRVGLQCVYCSQARHKDPKRTNEATMATFYPKAVSEIYRLVTNWTRCHLRKCQHVPPDIRNEWERKRANDKSRGKTQYWADSARQLGLVDCHKTRAGGVRFQETARTTTTARHGQQQQHMR